MTAKAAALSQAECLDGVLAHVALVARGGRRPVVLFDLDDTVLSTTPRHRRILREFATQPPVSARWPDACARLSMIEPPGAAYSVVEAAKGAGVEDEWLLEDLRRYWFARFFTSEYVLEDCEVPGAPDYCRRLSAAGALIAYVTGRDESMRPGTEMSLAMNGFPIPGTEQARLVLKPRFDFPDLEFKLQALDAVAGWGVIAAGFENEPAHINLFADRFPDGKMVFVETKHSGKPIEPYASIGRIRDYRLT